MAVFMPSENPGESRRIGLKNNRGMNSVESVVVLGLLYSRTEA